MGIADLPDRLGTPATFWIYAALGLAAIAFSLPLVPETKDRSLEDIEAAAADRDAAHVLPPQVADSPKR